MATNSNVLIVGYFTEMQMLSNNTNAVKIDRNNNFSSSQIMLFYRFILSDWHNIVCYLQ